MLNDVLILIAGIACAGFGGELFVRGAVGLARWACVPAGIIGSTVAAFATSSPELSVAVNAAIENRSIISLGNAIGANAANLGAILGITLLISSTRVEPGSLKRDMPVALLAPVITGLMAVDGNISRLDGAVMLVLFAVWLVSSVIEAKRARGAAVCLPESGHLSAIVSSIVGLVLLGASGKLIVDSASSIAQAVGFSAFVISATVVSIGTTIPELVTSVVAKIRGHQELALGVVLGSNIFNGLFIVGVATVISPFSLAVSTVVPGLIAGAVLVALVYPARGNVLERRRGAYLLAVYSVFLMVTLQLHR